MTVSVTTLVENAKPENKCLAYEHGLSFHVRTPQSTFLFDCGATDIVVGNAKHLNIDLEKVDFIVCSHAHYDHCGGFRHIVDKTGIARLYTGEGFFLPKYAVDGFRHTYLGLDFNAAFLAENSISHHQVGDMLQLDDYCWLLGNFARSEPAERIPERFKLLDNGAFVSDRFAEEICLAIRFRDGVAVLAGCSHPGIVNILGTVRARLGMPVRGVWGGTHLSQAEPERIEATVASLKHMGIRYFGLSHCSGDAVLERIKADRDMEGCHLRAGDGVFL